MSHDLTPSLVVRTKLGWRVLVTYLAASVWASAFSDVSAVVPALALTALAVCVWLQRIEVRGGRVTKHWTLHRGEVDLCELRELEVRRDRTRGLYRVVALRDRDSSLSFMLIGWDRWPDLVRLVIEHAVAPDEAGVDTWSVDTKGDVDRLFDETVG